MNESSLRSSLQALKLPGIHFYDETGSTNENALALAAQNAPEFTLVIAERQTAGRGRFGRRWQTAPNASLAFTIILRPSREERERLGFFSFLGAVGICLAIEELSTAKPCVKWPNDVLLDGRKTAGVLAEASWRGDEIDGLVLGMGINLLPGSVPPPDEVMFPATCVQAHVEVTLDREEFLFKVLENLINWRRKILTDDFYELYCSRLAFIGKSVKLAPTEGVSVFGTMLGINRTGDLRLKLDDGENEAYPIGDLSLRISSGTVQDHA